MKKSVIGSMVLTFLLSVVLHVDTALNAQEFNFQGNLPIHQAIKDEGPHSGRFNTFDTFKELLQDPHNLNARNEWGMTPLMVATANNKIGIVGILLDKGADINAQDREGDTALHIAAAGPKGLKPIMELLLSRGADQTIKNNHGETAEHHVRKFKLQEEADAQSRVIDEQNKKIENIQSSLDFHKRKLEYSTAPYYGKILSSGDIIRLKALKGGYLGRRDNKIAAIPLDNQDSPNCLWEIVIEGGSYAKFKVPNEKIYIISDSAKSSKLGNQRVLLTTPERTVYNSSWNVSGAYWQNNAWHAYDSMNQMTGGGLLTIVPDHKRRFPHVGPSQRYFLEIVRPVTNESSPTALSQATAKEEEAKIAELEAQLAKEMTQLETIRDSFKTKA